MEFPFDQSTIAFFSLFFYGILAIFFFTLWIGNRHHVAGLGYWTINLVLQVVGKSISISSIIPNVQLASIIGYLLSSTGAVFFYFGLAAFTHTAIHKKFYYALLAVIALIIVLSVNFISNPNARSIVYGIAVLFISSRYLALVWKKTQSESLVYPTISVALHPLQHPDPFLYSKNHLGHHCSDKRRYTPNL